MRSERVLTNLSCNQNCTYCASRAADDNRAFVDGRAVRARIETALGGEGGELVLTGGEPTMRRDLPELIRHARSRGATRVVLETNATLLDGDAVRALREAGLDVARVNLAGWGAGLDAVTRDPGGFAATLRGLDALVAAGVKVEAQVALVRSTRSLVADLPAALAARGVRGLRLNVPVTGPEPDELLAYPEVAEILVEIELAARRAALPVKLAADSGPPPCVLPRGARLAHLYALTPGQRARSEWVKVDACGGCQVADRCPGFPTAYLARWPLPPVRPVSEDRLRRRLSLIADVEEQVARELVTPNRYKDIRYGENEEEIVRVNFHCNQTCRFCFVSTHLPPAGDEAVRTAIRAAGARGHKVTLSGGEPALNPRLAEYVALAKASSAISVQVQTNATLLDDPARVEALRAAGLDEAFVSLHGSTAEISDAVTGAPGTFARTLVGIDNLHAAGIKVILNFVLCETNFRDFGRYARLVGERWPKAFLNVSFVAASTDVVPRDREFIPRYSEVLPHLEEGMALARRFGVEVGGFDSMCGIPLCLVPGGTDAFASLAAVPPGYDQGEFVKTDTCRACALEPRCWGVRRGYVDMHGASELRAVEARAKD